MNHILLTGALLAFGLAAQPALATTFLNQLPADVTSVSVGSASQRFESANASFNIGTLDDFTLSSASTLTNIYAALITGAGATDFSGIQNYAVEIYTSVAAAASNLTGNVASVTQLPGAVTLTHPYTIGASGGLVNIPVNISLAAGSYWLAVIPRLDFGGGGQVYVDENGVGNAFQANPGGGFGFPGNQSALNVASAYRIDGTVNVAGVPEPAAWMLMIGGLGLVGGAMRRRSMKTAVTYA